MVIPSREGTYDPTNIWLTLASQVSERNKKSSIILALFELSQVLYIVSPFLDASTCAPFRTRSHVGELLRELKACSIDMNLVCAYMVLGNVTHHEGIFKDTCEFKSGDPFLGYCFWFLIKQVFIEAAKENKGEFAVYELPAVEAETLTGSPAIGARYDRYLEALNNTADIKITELQRKVQEDKRDLFQYFFLNVSPGSTGRNSSAEEHSVEDTLHDVDAESFA